MVETRPSEALVARWIPAAVAAGLILSLTILGCGPQSRPFDNVILVTIDTLRADHLGSYAGMDDRAQPGSRLVVTEDE